MLTESSKRAKKTTLQAEIATPNVRHLHRTLNSVQPWGSVYMWCVYAVCVCINVYMDAHTHNRYLGNQNKGYHDTGDRFLKHSFTEKKLYCRNGNSVVPRTWIPFSSLPFLLSLLSFSQTHSPTFLFQASPQHHFGHSLTKGHGIYTTPSAPSGALWLGHFKF